MYINKGFNKIFIYNIDNHPIVRGLYYYEKL